MADRITASHLRANVYRILDQVLESGRPVEIERRGRMLRLIPVGPPSRLARLKRRRLIKGDPEALVHLDWSQTRKS